MMKSSNQKITLTLTEYCIFILLVNLIDNFKDNKILRIEGILCLQLLFAWLLPIASLTHSP